MKRDHSLIYSLFHCDYMVNKVPNFVNHMKWGSISLIWIRELHEMLKQIYKRNSFRYDMRASMMRSISLIWITELHKILKQIYKRNSFRYDMRVSMMLKLNSVKLSRFLAQGQTWNNKWAIVVLARILTELRLHIY